MMTEGHITFRAGPALQGRGARVLVDAKKDLFVHGSIKYSAVRLFDPAKSEAIKRRDMASIELDKDQKNQELAGAERLSLETRRSQLGGRALNSDLSNFIIDHRRLVSTPSSVLGVLVNRGTSSVEGLASHLRLDPDAVQKICHSLASVGILYEIAPQVYSLVVNPSEEPDTDGMASGVDSDGTKTYRGELLEYIDTRVDHQSTKELQNDLRGRGFDVSARQIREWCEGGQLVSFWTPRGLIIPGQQFGADGTPFPLIALVNAELTGLFETEEGMFEWWVQPRRSLNDESALSLVGDSNASDLIRPVLEGFKSGRAYFL